MLQKGHVKDKKGTKNIVPFFIFSGVHETALFLYNVIDENPNRIERRNEMIPKEGDVYKIVEVFGKRFELRYGYYEEYERSRGDPPIPIYPDFKDTPLHTDEGYPFVTQMQELCEYGESSFEDGVCADCRYYRDGEELIGVCLLEKNRKTVEKEPKG